MSQAEPHKTDTTAGLAPLSVELEKIAKQLGVKSVLVMRSEPDSMVVAATAGEATQHYSVGAAGRVVGTVCVLDDAAREYTDAERAQLSAFAGEVEQIIDGDGSALG